MSGVENEREREEREGCCCWMKSVPREGGEGGEYANLDFVSSLIYIWEPHPH